jgi:H+/gluconate symporter-like permease
MLPILVVIALNFVMAKQVLPALDTSYLAKPEFGGLQDARSLIGIWAIIVALSAAILLLVALHWRRWTDLMKTVNEGSFGSMLPILNTATEVGYGTVIASLAGFVVIRDLVLGIAPGNPLISEAVAVNVLAGITGSASGGMSIALKTLGAEYLAMASAAGISPELLHRVAAMASGCMDSLPHNGAVISLLAICRLTHRESYGFIFMNTVVFPLAALAVVITLGTLFGNF